MWAPEMTYPIGNNSNELINENQNTTVQRRQAYPFAALQQGQSFSVPIAEANVKSLRTRCSQLSVNGKRYALRVWENHGVVEVGRLSDVAQGQAASYSITTNSPEIQQEIKPGPQQGSQQQQTAQQEYVHPQDTRVGMRPNDFYAPGYNPNNNDWNSQS